MVLQQLIGYWLGYVAEGKKLSDIPSTVNIIALAFGVITEGNTLTLDFLTSKHSKEEILQGITFLKNRGQKVIMSINGNPHYQDGGWNYLDAIQFARNIKRIIDEWSLDGIDLDNENTEELPNENFVQTIKQLRNCLGSEAIISLPVYMGSSRDSFLSQVKDEISFVSTMAYWNNYEKQIELYNVYATLVGPTKVAIGVAEAANPGQNTDFKIVGKLAQYNKNIKYGMMLWHLNSTKANKWVNEIKSNMD